MPQKFEEEYWKFEERIRQYDLENLGGYYEEALQDIEKEKTIGTSLILDVGCGYGYLIQVCGKKGYKCIGVDISKYASLKNRDKSSEVILCSIQSTLPLKPESIDIAVMLDVLEHLHKPSLAIEEIKRVLRPEGLLYIATPNLSALARLLKGRNWYGYLDKTHVSLFTCFSLKKLLEKNKFKILKCYTPFSFLRKRKVILKALGRTYLGGQIRLIAKKLT